MSENPVIGIAAEPGASAQPYADAIQRSDGTPWLILPTDGVSAAEALVNMRGLIITTGPDIDGSMELGEESHTSREALLLKAALEKDMPVLGLSSGIHTLNVALGGTLAKDSHSRESENIDARK